MRRDEEKMKNNIKASELMKYTHDDRSSYEVRCFAIRSNDQAKCDSSMAD